MDASDQSPDCAPLAALLYEPGGVPGIEGLMAEALRGKGFSVTHAAPASEGWAEILRDGLTFDLRGLAAGSALQNVDSAYLLGVQRTTIEGCVALTLSPGPHLAGAEQLLPVIRVAAGLLLELARIESPKAICWNPAKNAVSPELFARAISPWLDGGPFPALALAALQRIGDGSISSTGLKFLIGQEFQLISHDEARTDHLTRVAIRLIDWLVAHGPVSKPVEANLAGTGAVFLEAQDGTRIVARCA